MKSLEDIKAAHAAGGGHWFDDSTMRLFQSRIMNTIHDDGFGGAYFVSSERHATDTYVSKRRYSVRHIDSNGAVVTVGEFMQHDSSREAFKAIEGLI